jgi:hypothetical protein
MKLRLIYILFGIIGNSLIYAQVGPPAGPSCWPPPCIPIDGGVGFLIAAGIAYGVKKINDIHKTK